MSPAILKGLAIAKRTILELPRYVKLTWRWIQCACSAVANNATALWSIGKVRFALAGAFCLFVALYLFFPFALFGDEYRTANNRLKEELQIVRSCPISWQSGGTKSFVSVLISLEDRGFFTRPAWLGIDVKGIARAFVKNIASLKVVEGASTLQWQVAKLLSHGAARKWGLRQKLLEIRLSFNLLGATHGDILALYSRLLDCGLSEEQGLVSCSLNLYGKFPQDLSPEEGAALAGMQSAPTVFRRYSERLNARVAAGVNWLQQQHILIPFAKEGSYITPFSSYPHFRGYQPPSQCYEKDPDSWTYQKMLTEAVGIAVPEVTRKAELTSHDPDISIGVITCKASAPHRILSRFGKWTEKTAIPVGSILKPLLLELYIRWLGADRANTINVPVGACVSDLSLKDYCPGDIGMVTGPLTLPQAVAKSVNSASVTALVRLPYYLYAQSPKKYKQFVSVLGEKEIAIYSRWPDRVLGAKMLGRILGQEIDPKSLPDSLCYRVAELAALRRYKLLVKDFTGVEIAELLSSLLGAEVKMTPYDIARYYGKLFYPEQDCSPSLTAELLTSHAQEGTLRGSFARVGFSLPGKTGTTNHSALAIIGACVSPDGTTKGRIPIITVTAATDHSGKEIDLEGSSLGAAFVSMNREMAAVGYDFQGGR